MNVLTRICTEKRAHIDVKKARTPLSVLEQKITEQTPPRGFKKKIIDSPPALIAEVKKASPSRGVIREDFDPVAIAKAYERAGASCLSILTDEPYFQGRDEYLIAVRDAVALPVLRKDFMLDPYQIVESRVLGADCILLIMAALSDSQAQELASATSSLGMDILTEIHNRSELDRALEIGADMIGINNRDLKTLNVDIQNGLDLAIHLPPETVKIAESGIATHQDWQTFEKAGFQGFLVGESLMRQTDIEAAARKLRTGA